MREIDPMDDPDYHYSWEDEQEQSQHPEDRLFCVECGNWGWEENGEWVDYIIDGEPACSWFCIHCFYEYRP